MDESTAGPVIRKVFRRLIPFLILCYLLNFIDRTNVAMTKSSMQETVPGFTAAVYTTGLTLLFLPYCLFELPSNLIMRRVGARRWIARIMITWGMIASCFVFIRGVASFYWLRSLLGLAEAGFFPGIFLYLSYWIPHRYRARAAGLFLLSQALAQVIGNILAGYILFFARKYGLPGHDWQWVYVVEGVPTILVGIWAMFYLTDYPAEAAWLTEQERAELTELMARDQAHLAGHSASDFVHALQSPFTWVLSLLYGLAVWAYLPGNSFTPAILKKVLVDAHWIVLPAAGAGAAATGPTPTPEHLVNLYLGLLSAIPFGVAAVMMLVIARHSDRHNERKYHLVGVSALMALGLVIAALAPRMSQGMATPFLTLAGLSMMVTGFFGFAAVFWALPAQLLTGAAVATALAIINSLGNLMGSGLGPQVNNLFKLNDEEFMLLAAACAATAAVITLMVRFPPHGEPSGPAEAQGFPAMADGAGA